MKKYVKPVMEIDLVNTLDLCQITTSIGGGEGPTPGGPGSGGGDAKERDFDEDMEVLKIIEDANNEKKNLW